MFAHLMKKSGPQGPLLMSTLFNQVHHIAVSRDMQGFSHILAAPLRYFSSLFRYCPHIRQNQVLAKMFTAGTARGPAAVVRRPFAHSKTLRLQGPTVLSSYARKRRPCAARVTNCSCAGSRERVSPKRVLNSNNPEGSPPLFLPACCAALAFQRLRSQPDVSIRGRAGAYCQR